MADLPSGTVTFLFTDIEGSTALWERDRTAMAAAVGCHVSLLDTAIQRHGGVHFKTVGDAVQAAFPTAPRAVAAALDAQRALLAEDWGETGSLRVRMALHAGDATPDERGDYLAAPLNRLSRLLATGYGGQILLSQTVQQLLRGALQDRVALRDLGEHRLRDLLEPERVFQLLHPELPDQFPALKSLEARPNNLPRQPTPFLGRVHLVREVVALLNRADVQLLTLTGPGGTGKTRLALQAAVELLDDFADGVFLVELAPVADTNLVPSAIGTALGLREEGNQSPQDAVTAYLRHKALLLVLDNFEHLLEAAPVVGRLLNACPGVKVLATSRAPLRLRAERLHPVPPLTTPDSNAPEDREAIARSEAVQLFVERAQASDPGFMLTPEAVPAIADIVRRLDGLPLAIELAAVRVRLLPPVALLTRLKQRLPLLTGGARDAPARQQTLRATIAWSHDLLGPEEQTLFRRLAVFAGGCTFEAAEPVVNPDGDLDVLGGITALVDHNLLRQAEGVDGDPRFTMLETVTEYALELLAANGEGSELRHRHAQYFLSFAETATDHLLTADRAEWFDRLEVEHPNFRAALQWSADKKDGEVLSRLASVLSRFWAQRGHQREGVQWLDRALTMDAPPSARLRCLLRASGMAYQQGNDRRATELAEEALALAERSGSPSEIADAQLRLGHALLMEGDPQRPVQLLTEALESYQSVGDSIGEADVLHRLTELAETRGNFEQARSLAEQALAALRAAGDVDGIAYSLFVLGMVSSGEGDGDRAITLIEEAAELWQQVGSTSMVGLARLHLGGLLADHRGDDTRAEPLLSEALNFWRQAGNTDIVIDVLVDLGHVARRRGDLVQAEARYQEAVTLNQELEDPVAITICAVKANMGFGQVARSRGETEQALSHFQDGLEHLRAITSEQTDRVGPPDLRLKRSTAECLRLVACTAAPSTNAVRAARVLGAAAACRTASLVPMLGAERAQAEEDAASVRDLISETDFKTAWDAGQELSISDAITEALMLISDGPTSTH
jgi:predicted ATPase/class 3 adenylate cyclase/Tfp pilus assembly protein PilF